jgi:hypothetical protein
MKKFKQKTEKYDNANRGALFENDKEGKESRPDYTGKLEIRVEDFPKNEEGNLEVRLAAWVKESDRVGAYLSVNASAPRD